MPRPIHSTANYLCHVIRSVYQEDQFATAANMFANWQSMYDKHPQREMFEREIIKALQFKATMLQCYRLPLMHGGRLPADDVQPGEEDESTEQSFHQ